MKKKWQFQDLSLARIYKNEDGNFILYSSEYPTGIDFNSSNLLDNLVSEDFVDADEYLELDDYLYEDNYLEFECEDEDEADDWWDGPSSEDDEEEDDDYDNFLYKDKDDEDDIFKLS